ncbi:hypothetical protein ANCDUO_02323 [Ancylostoma duodenale]|uniref:Uncharacterized protein n=1 Tax=Ancylostoma duodenale TaxID=51022 RepID=A0A0C2DC06_9BILA|nr:hypothetical protein ANCDUO_02323 [Ancylostoma duodenale]
MLFWQFSQFAFFTQVGSLFVVYTFDFIPRGTMETLISAHLTSFAVAFVMLFGNEMLLTSLYLASIIASLAHIFDILRSKFSNYSTFHTRLYTCSAEFDFMPFETLQKLSYTWLIPCAFLGIFLFVVFYNAVQTFCYSVMALLIMRLKLFMTPHLCICCAILANNEVLRSINIRLDKRIHAVLVVAIIAAMASEGKSNIEKQLRIKGEYSNPEQELLFDWIQKETKPTDVFAGTMPVMANVKLSTLRPILNHPHYEDVGIRERTEKVYSVFSKKPINEVHSTLKKMGANYFVFQLFNCAPEPNRPYCAYRGMWDEHDKRNIERVSNCDLFNVAVTQHDPSIILPFSIAYTRNLNYVVLKI